MVNVRKRGKGYQYYFEIAPVDGKRKQQVKSGFKTKKVQKNIKDRLQNLLKRV